MSATLRFTRQTRLPEIGERGQARLSAALVPLTTSGFAADIEARYLRGAGVMLATTTKESPRREPAIDLGIENAEAREVTVRADGTEFRATVRLDTDREREYLRHGGILPYVLRRLLSS